MNSVVENMKDLSDEIETSLLAISKRCGSGDRQVLLTQKELETIEKSMTDFWKFRIFARTSIGYRSPNKVNLDYCPILNYKPFTKARWVLVGEGNQNYDDLRGWVCHYIHWKEIARIW